MLSRGRSEAGGVGEDYELRLWIHHGDDGLPELPKTGDTVEYDNTRLEGGNGGSDLQQRRVDRQQAHREGGLMAKKFRGPELIKEIDKALDKGLARFIITTHVEAQRCQPG